MNFNNSFDLFCLFIYLCLSKQNVKMCLMIKLYIPYSENLYTFYITKYYIEIFLITVAKTGEKVLMLNMALATKMKVENFQT